MFSATTHLMCVHIQDDTVAAFVQQRRVLDPGALCVLGWALGSSVNAKATGMMS